MILTSARKENHYDLKATHSENSLSTSCLCRCLLISGVIVSFMHISSNILRNKSNLALQFNSSDGLAFFN